jgi:hypothetical protein
MDELIGRLVAKVGIDNDVAEKTIGIILGFLRNEGPSEKVQSLIDNMPGAEAAIAASSDGSGLGRLMGGGLMALGTRLMGLGLGMSEIQNIARELLRFGREKIGTDRMGEIIAGIRASDNSLKHLFHMSIMTYPISDIDGLTAFTASKLKSVGIRTTEGLLEAARTVKGRKTLAAKTGISEQQLLEWANVSDYMRIPGMGKAKVGLVRAAGVTTVRELALRNPARLARNMKDVNTKRKLVRILPSEKAVEQLIAQARKLQPKITY